ncbi:MAG: HAD family hydrolase [Epsilonproteobacteria bacterium]|nr:HAD family hydrolase [Campylobacterota bacterium]
MIKTILWDFDGVISDSMKIKGDGFLELFSNYDEKYLELIEQYHYINGGVSRFDKIRYFYNEILKEEISEDKVEKLANKFAQIIEKKLYDKNNLIQDSLNFIHNTYNKYDFHIVSGAEHVELNELCQYFELNKYFISINGSPTKKDILIKNLIEKYTYRKNEIILIGDAMSDYCASIKNGIGFYGYNNLELKNIAKQYINNFKESKI